MFPSRIRCAESKLVAGGDCLVQVNPLSVERNMPCCSVPSHRSWVTGLKPSPYTLPPFEVAVEALVAVCPPSGEIHAPLAGAGAQNPPPTIGLPGKVDPGWPGAAR